MKLFYKKLGFFIILIILICLYLGYISMKEPWGNYIAEITNSKEYSGEIVGAKEIIPFIERVQKQDGTKILILGDSVCNQMFMGLQEYNNHITIAGTNGAITMAGQFILAKEYLDNHTNVTDIYMILHPNSLIRTFDITWGYQYAIVPFVQTKTLELLDKNTIQSMEKVYGKIFLQSKGIEMIEKSSIGRKIYFNTLKKYGEGYYPNNTYEIADQYIQKIYQLCEEKNVNFHLYASPVSDERRDEMKKMEEQYQTTWLKTVFPNFFNDIFYFSSVEAEDTTHFSGEYASQDNYNKKIKEIFNDSKLIRELRMY